MPLGWWTRTFGARLFRRLLVPWSPPSADLNVVHERSILARVGPCPTEASHEAPCCPCGHLVSYGLLESTGAIHDAKVVFPGPQPSLYGARGAREELVNPIDVSRAAVAAKLSVELHAVERHTLLARCFSDCFSASNLARTDVLAFI